MSGGLWRDRGLVYDGRHPHDSSYHGRCEMFVSRIRFPFSADVNLHS